MFSILRHYGIPEKVVNAIKAIYKNSRAVIVEGNISEEFDVTVYFKVTLSHRFSS